MISANYHIVSPDAAFLDPDRCDLIIAVGHHFFQYVLIEEKDRVIASKFYQLPSSEERNWADLLEDILISDELLNKDINVAAVAYAFPETQLVPSGHYIPSLGRELISLVHGDLQEGLILDDSIEEPSLHHTYRVPAELHAQLEKKLAPKRFRHFYSFWLQQITTAGQYAGDHVSVLFYPGELLVMLVKGDVLQLVQQIPYGTAEDVSYHLINIYRHFDLSPEVQPLRIGGMIEVDSAMYEELLKYFLTVEIESPLPGLQLAADLNGLPDHFFSPLLKIVPCVL